MTPRGTAAHWALLLSLVVLMTLNTSTVQTTGADATRDLAVQFTGPGTWGGGPANATWTVIDGTLQGFLVESGEGTTHCHLPHDRNATATCSGERQGADTYRFAWSDATTSFNGTFEATDRAILLDAGTATPSPIPGTIVVSLAALFFAATIILGVLFVQERRVSRYLVRRLYEETKGRMPPDWPKHLRQQWIARAFIRGKN